MNMDVILYYIEIWLFKMRYCVFALCTSVVHIRFLEKGKPYCLEQKLNFYV